MVIDQACFQAHDEKYKQTPLSNQRLFSFCRIMITNSLFGMVFNRRFFMRASILQHIILARLHHLSPNRPNVHDIIDFKPLSLTRTEFFIIDLHPNLTTSTLLVWFFLEIDPPLRNRSRNWNGRGPKVYFVTMFFSWNILEYSPQPGCHLVSLDRSQIYIELLKFPFRRS